MEPRDKPKPMSIRNGVADACCTHLKEQGDIQTIAEGTPPEDAGRVREGTLVIGGLLAFSAEVVSLATGQEASWPAVALALVSIVTTGLPTLKNGLIALKNLTLTVDFLMSLAVGGAVILGKWPEAAVVVFLFALAEAIEGSSLEKARNAIKSLAVLAPETAEVKASRIDSSHTQWREQPVANVALGSRIRVRAGKRVPLDARVESGRATLDQAPITGESLPVDKKDGDPLYAGSIVTDGVVEATVTAVASESTLARIAASLQEAQSQRAPMQRFLDRFARYYTPAVVVLAVLLATLGPAVFGGSRGEGLYQALVLLVISCPCALVLSTPVAVASGLAAAARQGILVKGGVYLERGRHLKAVAFDKTGTLTHGKPSLTDAEALNGMPIERALWIAASLDEPSTHPIAQALVGGWQKRHPKGEPLPVEGFGVLTGLGVQGEIEGERWYLGNHRLVEALGVCSGSLEGCLAKLEHTGKTGIVLFSASGPAAVFGIADTLRPESYEAVAGLQALNVEPVMLSGDNQASTRAIADQLGIREARGNLMPEDKQKAIQELKERYGAVGMLGDGVNDALALAKADIGLAMGAAGTATALETADVAIMDDDPRKVADFIGLSKRTVSVLKQNITLALGIKFAFLALALMGHATLWMAVFADMGGSLLVVANGLRLLGARPKNPAPTFRKGRSMNRPGDPQVLL